MECDVVAFFDVKQRMVIELLQQGWGVDVMIILLLMLFDEEQIGGLIVV